MIWATVSSRSCFCWLYSFSMCGCKEYNQSDFGIGHLLMSMCRVFSCAAGRGEFAVTSVFSWQNCINFWPASFCSPRPNLPVTLDISRVLTFAFQSPIMKRTSFLGVFLEGLVGLHWTIQFQLFQHYWSGHRLGLLWYWMVCLGDEQRSFSRFCDCIQVLHFGLFCWPWGLLQF